MCSDSWGFSERITERCWRGRQTGTAGEKGAGPMRLAGKVVVISGSGERMGKAVPLLMAQEGAKIVLGARTAGRLEETAARIRAAGGEAIPVAGDANDPEYMERLIGTAVSAFGRIDIMYNNAGGGFGRQGEGSSIASMSLGFWENNITNNLRTTFLGAKIAAAHMGRQGGGVIINVAADYRVRQLGTIAYGAAKNGIIGFTQNLARELWPQNIRVHCICPGLVRIPLPDGPIQPRTEGGLTRQEAAEDIAYAAVYLASDESAWTTGVILNVDGGNEVLAFDGR